MILCGLILDHCNCAGYGGDSTDFFEADELHDAVFKLLRYNRTSSFGFQQVKNGEFHDTNTHVTWSVDSRGHTKKDYRIETEYDFRERWEN